RERHVCLLRPRHTIMFWSTFYDVRGNVGNRPWSLVLRQKSFVRKLVNAVIVGNRRDRRRALIRKLIFEHAQKFSWRSAFFNVSFKRWRTFVERFINFARSRLAIIVRSEEHTSELQSH